MVKRKHKHHHKHKSFRSKFKPRVKKNVKSNNEEPDELKRAPHSFVIHRGKVGRYILELEKDFRKVMDPFTASSLQVQKKNTLKDFVSISSLLKVSHLIIFTNSEIGPYMRITRLPQGPTLMFRIHNYSLARDVLSTAKKQMTNKKLFTNAPLIILNNFTGEGSHIKLMASIFQNMFPTINVTKVRLSDIRRCVMLNYNTETKAIDFRHYAIKAVPVGISRGVKKIVQNKIPNLAKYEDISEFLTKPSMTDSEAEDDPSSHVEVPQKLHSRGNMISQQSSIRLHELGPRMSLQLIKVEEGLLNGEVMFHELIQKTEKEKLLIRKKLAEKRRLKEHRKSEQEANVKRKEQLKEEHKQKSLEGMQRKAQQQLNGDDVEDVEDDVEYFRNETGSEPREGVFSENADGERKKTEYGFKRRKKKENSSDNFKSKNFKKKENRSDNFKSKNFKRKETGNDNFKSKNFKKKESGSDNFKSKNFKKKGIRSDNFKSKNFKLKHKMNRTKKRKK